MAGSKTKVGDVKGDVFGVGVSGKGHSFQKVHVEHQHNTIQITAGENIHEVIRGISAMNTEIMISTPAGTGDDSRTENTEKMKNMIGELTQIAQDIQQQGTEIREIQAGSLRISKTELLLKKAIILKSEADDMLLDQLAAGREKAGNIWQGGGHQAEIDLNDYMSGFNERAWTRKLTEAQDTLREANRIDPANVEVLLHLAQVTGQLEPDNPDKERNLLRRVLNLLKSPKNDDERYHRAEATFLMATVGDETHPDLLEDARNMFSELGREDWVRHCDSLLSALGNIPQMTGYPQQASQSSPHVHGHTQPHAQSSYRVEFHTTGRWHVQVSEGSVMDLHLFANGMVQGTQQNNMLALYVTYSGQWTYLPANGMLQIQGYVNNSFPFFLSVAIQGNQNGIFSGTGMDGHHYQFTRTG
jgi:hypothetical protein